MSRLSQKRKRKSQPTTINREKQRQESQGTGMASPHPDIKNKIKTTSTLKNKTALIWSFFRSPMWIIWSVLSSVVTIHELWTLFTPTILILRDKNLDPQEQYQTQISITSSGGFGLGVDHVAVSCSLLGPDVPIGHMSIGDTSSLRVEHLGSGETTSISCFKTSYVKGGALLEVTAQYTWPLLPWHKFTQSAYFSVKTGPAGSFLFPAPKPNLEPQRQITISPNNG